MEKLLCPYCDHEIKKAGRCGTCGSRVRQPIKVQTSAVYDTKPSAQPGECGCTVHSPKTGGTKEAARGGKKPKPVKNSYSPFIEHIKNLPTVTKIVLIYVMINLVATILGLVFAGL